MADQNFRVKRGLEVGVGVTIQAGIVTAVTLLDGNLNAPGKTYYVSKNGSDSYAGTTINRPFATLVKALSVATSGDTIFVQSGTFTEVFPLIVPVGVTVRGVGLRGTFIQPTVGTQQNDGFLLNGETTIEDLSIGNIYEPGYAFRFANNAKTTTRSPYVQRVTVLNKGSVITSTDPYGFDTAHSPPTSYKAGRGVLIDGSVQDPSTLEPAMLFNECTFITPNNTALEMTNGARTEWVNCFTYLADKGISAYDGTVGVASTGYVRVKTTGFSGTTPAANDELYYLEANSQSATYAQVGTALTITRVGHGLTVGNRVFADFTSGTATDGFYRVTGYVGVNTFSVTMAGSATTSGNVSYKQALGFGTVTGYTSATGLSSIRAKGEGLFEIPSSRLGKTVTAYGDAQLSTTQKKFGNASLYLDGTGDYARCEGGTDFAFSGNFTAETWIYPTSVTGTRYLFSLGSETTGRYNLSMTGGVLSGNFYGSASTNFGGSISANTWTHIALVRSGSIISVYVNGTVLGTTETNSSAIGNTGQLTIGADTGGASVFVGYFDEFRISNTARYTGTFTVASTPFTSDGSDKLLLHFDGIVGSTSFADSSIASQDIRWVRSGVTTATATKITLADYQQFGAEMRSIGSAVVFGNTGINASGPGVGLRLFAFNFGHIGSGKDFSQDVSLVNQAAEVVKSNNANVYFVSIDQGGDFRVGDAFYVNQEAGTVNFGGQNFTLNSLSDLNITDGTNTNTITPTTATLGNIQISGNDITSTSGNININPSGTSETFVDGNLNVSGILTASVLQTGALQKGDTSIAIDDTGTDGTIRFNTDAVEAVRITNQQRVGIGTTAPTVKLDVIGDANISGVITAFTFNGKLNSGIGTITTASIDLAYVKTGIVTNLSTSGIGTIATASVDLAYVKTGVTTNLTATGIGTITTASIDLAYVKTGVTTNLTATGIGTITTASIDLAYVKTGVTTNLTTTGIATVNVGILTNAYVTTGIVTTISGTSLTYTTGSVTNLSTSGIGTINTASIDLDYVKTGIVTNLITTGIATVNVGVLTNAYVTTGVVTTLSGTSLTYTTGSVTNLTSGISTVNTRFNVGTAVTIISGVVTATRFSTGDTGVGINISTNTISGPSEITIDPAGVGDNTGAVRIKGDLYVDGTTTQINSTTLEIADFIVGIASTATTDLLADGAGIKIGPDNTLLYDHTNTALKSSENLNLVSGKTYKINGTDVLSSTTLGSGVVNSSLTSVGTLSQVTVTGLSTFTNGFGVGTGVTIIPAGIRVNSGVVTASQFIRSGGTSSQFLKADGSVDSNTYLTSYTETDTLNSVTGRGNSTSNGISVGVLTATSGNFTGIITSSGENVTGVVTASSGVNVGTGVTIIPAGIRVNSGIVTASSFSGSASNLTGLTGASAATYGSATQSPQIVVDANGRITSITNIAIAGGGGSSQWTNTITGVTTTGFVGVSTTTSGNNPLQVGSGATVVVVDQSGNLGVGITNPYNSGNNATIEASGTIISRNNFAALSNGGNQTNSGAFIKSSNGFSTAGSPNYTFWYNSDTGIYHPSADNIGITIAGTERVRFNATGVGIGTTSPTEKIHVVGNARITGIVTASSFIGDGSGLTGVGFALTVGTRTAGVNNNDAVSNVKAIRFAKTPFSVTDLGSGEVLIQSESTFNPWYVAGQNTLKATGEEPIEFVAGIGIAITTKATASAGIGTTFSKAITISGGVVTQDEGSTVGTAGTINFVGQGVTATFANGTTTVTISGGSGGGGSATPGGVDTQVQFNDGGSTFNGDAGLTYNKTTDVLSITGGANIGTGVTIIPAGIRVNSGIVTASSFVKSGGTSSQFLKADGSVDSSTYLTSYTETDTLNSVTGRGNSTSNGISVGVLTATSGNFSGIITSSGENVTGVVTASSGVNVGTGITIIPAGIRINSGIVTASQFIRSGGTSSQFLKADGSVDSSTYLTSYTETDTLNSVTGRGNSTSNGISVGVLTATSGNFSGIITSIGANITGVVTATDFNSSSDINLKDNVRLIEDPVSKVMSIRGVNFEWKQNSERSAGVIAQEIEQIMPELVKEVDGKKSVNYNGLIGLLIEVVKDQQKQIDELKKKLS